MRKRIVSCLATVLAAGGLARSAAACDTVVLSTGVAAQTAVVSPLVVTAVPLSVVSPLSVDALNVRVQSSACVAAPAQVQVFSQRAVRSNTVVRQRVRVLARPSRSVTRVLVR